MWRIAIRRMAVDLKMCIVWQKGVECRRCCVKRFVDYLEIGKSCL
jgi:hypothetical protein